MHLLKGGDEVRGIKTRGRHFKPAKACAGQGVEKLGHLNRMA